MRGTVMNDLVAAGGNVEVDGPVHGDLIVAGGTVDVRQPVGGTVYASGGTVNLSSTVGRNVVVNGFTVQTLNSSKVSRDLFVHGVTVTLSGAVGHDVHTTARKLTVTDGAVIHGNLVGRAMRRVIAAGAVIGGQRLLAPERRHHGRWWWFTWPVLMGIMLFIVGAVFVALAPRLTEQTQTVIRTHPWGSLLAGLIILVVVPIASFIVLFIIPPLALIAMALYLIALYLAPIFLAIFVARLILRNPSGSLYLALLIGVALLVVLHWIPVLRAIVGFIVLLYGLGALFLAWQARSAHPLFPEPAKPEATSES